MYRRHSIQNIVHLKKSSFDWLPKLTKKLKSPLFPKLSHDIEQTKAPESCSYIYPNIKKILLIKTESVYQTILPNVFSNW